MRRSNDWRDRFSFRHTIRLMVGALVLGGALGCETTETTTPRVVDRPAALEEKPDRLSEDTGAGSELASIAERDVQAFLDRQKRMGSARDERLEPEPDRRRSDQAIQWNMPDESDPTAARPIIGGLPDVRSSGLFLLPDDDGQGGEPNAESDSPAEQTLDITSDRLRELIIELSKGLYREASYSDMPLRELLLIAASTMVTPDRALQPDAIPALTARERELLGEFQAFFTHIGQQLDGSRTADDVLLHALDELRAALSTQPQLYVETLALCTRVGGFGDYDPFNRYSFLAHSEQQAVLYLEIAGFTSDLNQQSQWVTELSLQLMIYADRDGIPVWREDWQTAVDVSRNKRQDFFMVQILTLPKALSVGRYHLKVRVRDEKSGAEAEGSIPFEMVADPKLAAGGGR